MGKIFRMNRLIVVVVAILIGASALLLLPSRRQVRDQKFRSDFTKRYTIGTSKEIEILESAAKFSIAPRNPAKGKLFVFIPTLNNNIAFLSNPTSSSFLSGEFHDVEVNAIPIPDASSPTTTLALKLALQHPGRIGQSFIDEVANHPTLAKAKLDKAWEQMTDEAKTTAETKMQSNLQLRGKMGKFTAVLQYKSFIVKAETWNDLQGALRLLHEYYQ